MSQHACRKFVSHLTLTSLSLGLVLTAACSKKHNPAPDESFRIKIDVPVKDKEALPADLKALHTKLQNGDVLDFNQFTGYLINLHISDYQTNVNSTKTNEDFLAKIRETLKKTDKPTFQPHDFKVAYEEVIELDHQPNGLMYKSSAVQSPAVFFDGYMQCYSGTVTNEILTRTASASYNNFKDLNRVVIHEAGHVLPGYMSQEDGQWRLYGIETTAAGRAIVDYGNVKELNEILRVGLADDFVVSEIFKKYLDPNRVGEFRALLLKRAAEKYGIPSTKLEGLISEAAKQGPSTPVESAKAVGQVYIDKENGIQASAVNGAAFTALNASPLSFGRAEVSDQPQKRAIMDSRVRGSHAFHEPSRKLTATELRNQPSLVWLDERHRMREECQQGYMARPVSPWSESEIVTEQRLRESLHSPNALVLSGDLTLYNETNWEEILKNFGQKVDIMSLDAEGLAFSPRRRDVLTITIDNKTLENGLKTTFSGTLILYSQLDPYQTCQPQVRVQNVVWNESNGFVAELSIPGIKRLLIEIYADNIQSKTKDETTDMRFTATILYADTRKRLGQAHLRRVRP